MGEESLDALEGRLAAAAGYGSPAGLFVDCVDEIRRLRAALKAAESLVERLEIDLSLSKGFEDRFRQALNDVSHVLKMPGSPSLSADVPQAVREKLAGYECHLANNRREIHRLESEIERMMSSARGPTEKTASAMPDGPLLGVKLLRAGARLPEYAHDDDAGMDVFACFEDPAHVESIAAGATVKIPLGIALDIPRGYFLDVRGRSGNELRGTIAVRLGTVDSEFRGELCAIVHAVYRWGQLDAKVKHGDKIAQLVLRKRESLPIVEVSELSESDRGLNGFGSSGQ